MNVDGHKAGDILKFVFFSIFLLPLILYWFFDLFCAANLMNPLPEPEKPEPEPSLEFEPEWDDELEDSWYEPEPQTEQKLIDEVIAGLQNLGFKKKDARIAVLKACEGKVFEDHQPLVEAALNNSNL